MKRPLLRRFRPRLERRLFLHERKKYLSTRRFADLFANLGRCPVGNDIGLFSE